MREEFTQWMLICRATGMLSDAAFNSDVSGVKFFFSMPGMRAAQDADSYSQWCKLLEPEPNQTAARD